MTSMHTFTAAAAAFCLGLAGAGAASAQAHDGPPPPPRMAGPHPGWNREDAVAMRQKMQARQAERARILHDALSLRPDQEAAFQALIASAHPMHEGPMHEGPMPGMRRDGEAAESRGQLTTPQRLDRMEHMMTERHAAFERHAAAIRAFYAVLTPAQQRTFDALALAHGLGGARGHGRGERHWGGPHHMGTGTPEAHEGGAGED